MKTRWMLPDGISDVLPLRAAVMERLRRALLDRYRLAGYRQVVPPLIEYLDALLTGSGRDLDLTTFKLVDQESGRTLGVRADTTPQVARIDAHLLDGSGIARLCYCTSVLHARSSGPGSSREPIQIGAELYGHPGPEADIEAIDLLLQSLAEAGILRVRLDLSDHGLVRLLLQEWQRTLSGDPLTAEDEAELFTMFESRDLPGLSERLLPHGLPTGGVPAAEALLGLALCVGTVDEVLPRARTLLALWPRAGVLLQRLEAIAASPRLLAHQPMLELGLDLADTRGFRYHTGVTFAAFVEGHAQAIGRGGRYDGAGRVFGHDRPATGFSLDLRALVELGPEPAEEPCVWVPWSDDPALAAQVAALRQDGRVVIQGFPGQTAPNAGGSVRWVVRHHDGRWAINDLANLA